ncbi:AAA family ATPase [Pseudomonas wadenswilerensis]
MAIDTGVWVRNYKSFGSKGGGFQKIKPINIIIGKNNIGKSSLIDAIEHMFSGSTSNTDSLIANATEFRSAITPEEINGKFSSNTSGGDIQGNHNGFGKRYIGYDLTWKRVAGKAKIIDCNLETFAVDKNTSPGLISRLESIALQMKRLSHTHIRLDADRDITKELYDQNLNLSSNGTGATNIIQMYINDARHDRSLIQNRLLSALNEIFNPDVVFSEILVQHHSDQDLWEIFLGEAGQQPVPLSSSGSGLKTVILTLLNILVRPDFEKKPLSSYIFSFEELENNLHPALQRNLFSFLLKFSQEHSCHIFLTTHSHVAIDLFHGETDAQIIHIKRQDGEVIGLPLECYAHGYAVLDDLGVKASDILQANGIIWVEGPSDRVYLNKFIEIWGEGAYKEGQHYQYIFYGGSVLANITTAPPDQDIKKAVNALAINRNFAFVCDSDRSHSRGKLKNRVVELLEENLSPTGHIWVTRCKEIENYIPTEAFAAVYGTSITETISEYEPIQDYMVRNHLTKATEYRDKHQKAMAFVPHFNKSNLAFRPELDKEIPKLIDLIRSWNTR